MRAEGIIAAALADGVTLTASSAETITAIGEQESIAQWKPIIKQLKPEILAELHREQRHAHAMAMLETSPNARYAMIVLDPNCDPVILSVAIRGVAVFDLSIPRQKYDGLAVLELFQKTQRLAADQGAEIQHQLR
jgi:hypothetical protein